MALARERRGSVPEYLPGPPDTATPALAYALAHEGEDSDDTVLATLLDLIDRGYYETGEATTEKEKLDLAIAQKADRPAGELTPYEQDVLAFFDQLLDGKRVALSEMKDEIPQHDEVWRGRWERMTEKLERGRGGRADLGPQPQRAPLADGADRGGGRSPWSSCSRWRRARGGSSPDWSRSSAPSACSRSPRPGSSASTRRTANGPSVGAPSPAGPRTSHASPTTRRRRSSCGSGSSSTGSPSAPPSG